VLETQAELCGSIALSTRCGTAYDFLTKALAESDQVGRRIDMWQSPPRRGH
jgi:hypothetical protein